jgi:hypothetical protein
MEATTKARRQEHRGAIAREREEIFGLFAASVRRQIREARELGALDQVPELERRLARLLAPDPR